MTERINYEQLGEFKAKKALSETSNTTTNERKINARIADQYYDQANIYANYNLQNYENQIAQLTNRKLIPESNQLLLIKEKITQEYLTLSREVIAADVARKRQILYKQTLKLKREAIKRQNEANEEKKEYLTDEEKNSRFRDIEKFKEANQRFIQLSQLQIAYENLLLKIEKHLHPDQYNFTNQKNRSLEAVVESQSDNLRIIEGESIKTDERQINKENIIINDKNVSEGKIAVEQETDAVAKEEEKVTEQSTILATETKNHLGEEQDTIIDHENPTASQDLVSNQKEKDQARVQELQNQIDALQQTPAYQDYNQYLKLMKFEAELKSLRGAEAKKEKFFLPIADRINFLEKEIPKIKKTKSYQDVLISQQIIDLKSQLAYLDYDDSNSLETVKELEPQIQRLSSKLNHENLPSVISEFTLLEKKLAALAINQPQTIQQEKQSRNLTSENNLEAELLQLAKNREKLRRLEKKLSVVEKILIENQKIDQIKKTDLYQKYYAGEKDFFKINSLVKKLVELDKQVPKPTKEIDQTKKAINKLKKGKKYSEYLITISYILQIISLKNELIKIKENQDFSMNEIKERGKYLQIKINNLQKLLPHKQMVEYQEYVIREIKYHENIINETISQNPNIALDEIMEDNQVEKLKNEIEALKSQIEVQSTAVNKSTESKQKIITKTEERKVELELEANTLQENSQNQVEIASQELTQKNDEEAPLINDDLTRDETEKVSQPKAFEAPLQEEQKSQESPSEAKVEERKNETNNHPSDLLTKITPEEANKIMDEVLINGDKYLGSELTTAILKEAGLQPQYKIKQGEQVVWFSSNTYYELGNRGRLAVVAYVEDKGKIFARTYYVSNSQGVWRYLPSYTVNMKNGEAKWFDKGYDETSATLPMESQYALAQLSQINPEPLTLNNSDLLFYGTAKNITDYSTQQTKYSTNKLPLYEIKKRGDVTYYHEVEQQPKKLAGLKNTGDPFIKIEPTEVDLLSAQKPNFNNKIRQWQTSNQLYGDIYHEVYLSQDESLLYIFCRDKRNRAWIGGIEDNQSELTSTGLKKSWYDVADLTTPAYEYKGQADDYNNDIDSKGSYVDLYQNYLSKIPIIIEYNQHRKTLNDQS